MKIEKVTAWKYDGQYYESELAALQALTLKRIDTAVFSLKRAASEIACKSEAVERKQAAFFSLEYRENLEEYLTSVNNDFQTALLTMQELEELIEAQS